MNLVQKIFQLLSKVGLVKKKSVSEKVMMPLRLALVGEMKGPDVMDILSVLGKKESLKRIENLIDKIK